jgi:hypothetical protein
MGEGRQLLQDIMSASFGQPSFQARISATEVKHDGRETIVSEASLTYRGPGSYRLEMLKSTKAAFQGAKLIFHAGETSVKVRPGGLLKFLPLTLPLADPQLLSLNGYRLDQVTGHGVLERVIGPDYEIKVHGKATVGGDAVQILKVTAPANSLDKRIAYEYIGFDEQHHYRLWAAYGDPSLRLPSDLLYQMTVDEVTPGVPVSEATFKL